MTKKKKAQSSIEYLGTYAWAFMGLLITIGTLNYFGVLNPSSYTPTRCDSGSQISCIDIYLASDTTLDQSTMLLLLQNNYPREITITNTTILLQNGSIQEPTSRQNIIVAPGRSFTMQYIIETDYVIGQKEQFSYVVTYKRYSYENPGTTIEHNISGSATVLIQEAPTTPEPYCGDATFDVARGEECTFPTMYEGDEITTHPQLLRFPLSDCTGDPENFCRSDCTCEVKPT